MKLEDKDAGTYLFSAKTLLESINPRVFKSSLVPMHHVIIHEPPTQRKFSGSSNTFCLHAIISQYLQQLLKANKGKGTVSILRISREIDQWFNDTWSCRYNSIAVGDIRAVELMSKSLLETGLKRLHFLDKAKREVFYDRWEVGDESDRLQNPIPLERPLVVVFRWPIHHDGNREIGSRGIRLMQKCTRRFKSRPKNGTCQRANASCSNIDPADKLRRSMSSDILLGAQWYIARAMKLFPTFDIFPHTI
jgi:hypothetical protein